MSARSHNSVAVWLLCVLPSPHSHFMTPFCSVCFALVSLMDWWSRQKQFGLGQGVLLAHIAEGKRDRKRLLERAKMSVSLPLCLYTPLNLPLSFPSVSVLLEQLFVSQFSPLLTTYFNSKTECKKCCKVRLNENKFTHMRNVPSHFLLSLSVCLLSVMKLEIPFFIVFPRRDLVGKLQSSS